MRLRIVNIESGSVYTDGHRRLTLRQVAADGKTDAFAGSLRVTDRELGIIGLALDDEVSATFLPISADAEMARELLRTFHDNFPSDVNGMFSAADRTPESDPPADAGVAGKP